MMDNQEKEYWQLSGDRIIIKNRSYSIFYITVLSFAVRIVSIALLAYSLLTFLYLQKSSSVAAMGLAFFTFLFGYILGNIAKKANNMYLDELDQELIRQHEERIRKIRAGEQ